MISEGRKLRLLNPSSSVNCPRGATDQTKQEAAFAQLAHFRERANLCFQSLVVLPLDLKLRLQLLHEQVQMGNLDAELLDVGRCRSWPNRGGYRLLGVVQWLQRLPGGERLGKRSWPGRFRCSSG